MGPWVTFNGRWYYSYRSTTLGYSNFDAADYTRANAQIDVSASKDFGKHFTIIATGTNVTGSNQLHYIGSGQMADGFYQRPITYTIGARARF